MHKPAKPSQLNKPLLLICLFTFATLAATLMHTGEARQADGAPAPVARDAGHGALPVCSTDALTLSAHCQPQPGRQA
ncbi:hypothetical protein [Janthinobacterium sp. GW458P]|uniref:hypothetical protein n=1 Tax=Janthinobacterium sp. GW458P TaxID=1981504 RepID=UPI000A32915B|nr:hypothetical protein [Janthinobacterium sp. GW458P]MBE3024496.1 hypothetical protein [Janthinobacterium sp. GW458P]PHV15256.1 hypothetical protein CSQ90_19790 [Janthinobacterium sp. BJB303]